MEVKYEDEDLALLLLVSLPSSFTNFCDTICISRDTLTLTKVYEALQQREKMKTMVQAESSSKAEALQVRGRTEQRTTTTNNNNDKSKTDRGCSKSKGQGDKTSSVGIVRKIITILIIVGSCRTRRKETVPTNLRINPMVMVRPLLFLVILMVTL
jgi:hypothetical protein